MALIVKSFLFEDSSFRDTPEVVNDEGTRYFCDQIRSPMQKKIAVIMKGTGDEEGKTIVKVIRELGSEQYEVVIDKDAKKWSVNDYGEVLLYTEHNSTKELVLLTASGEIKWTVDASGLDIKGVALGTSYAVVFLGDGKVRFHSTADGSLASEVDTGASPIMGSFFCPHDGYWGVCAGPGFATIFVSKDGEYHNYFIEYGRAQPLTTDAYASVVGSSKGYIIYRTGEQIEIGSSDDRVWVAPSGDVAMLVRSGQIELYSISKSGYTLISTTPFAEGQSGCIWADISFYGKYALILHDTNDLCVYNLEEEAYKDKLHNPLGSRPVMTCAD